MSFGSSATHKNMEGDYFYQKKKKRDRLYHTSSMAGQDTLVGEYYTGGPFIAETIWICNGDTETRLGQILDDAHALTCRFAIAPGTLVNLGMIWMPFFQDVNFWSDGPNVTIAVGGWIP